MAKKRFIKRSSTNVGMIEISENGVIKKILVPLASISTKNKKKPTATSKTKSKPSVPIAPKNPSSEANSSVLPPGNILDSSSIPNIIFGQNLPVCSTAPSTTFLGMPQTNCLSSSGSFVQPFQTFMINSAPVIISSNGSLPSTPTFPTSFQQQPLMLASKSVSQNSGSSFILQSSFSPFIQLPNPHSHLQLLSSPTALSPLRSLNQSQIYLNQNDMQNAVYMTPPAKSLILNQTNQLITSHIRPTLFENVTTKSTNPQGIIVNSSLNCQLLNASNTNPRHLLDKDETKSKDKGRRILKVKAILPKTSEQEEEKKLSPDKQNLINKLTLAAERTSSLPFHFPSKPQFSSVPNAKTSAQAGPYVNKQRQLKNVLQRRTMQTFAKGRTKGCAGKAKKLEISKAKNIAKDNLVKSMESKLPVHLDLAAQRVLGSQVPTVVLNQISIPPGVTTTKVRCVASSNNLKSSQVKGFSTYRSIKPKPPVENSCGENKEKTLNSIGNGEEFIQSGSKKCSKSNNESESDYTIAKMLDTDDSWSDGNNGEDEEYKGKIDCESRKRKSERLADKSYKCYLGRSAESSKYPRTRSFFRSKHSA